MAERDLLRKALLAYPGRMESVALGNAPFNYPLPVSEEPQRELPWGPLDDHLAMYGAREPQLTPPQGPGFVPQGVSDMQAYLRGNPYLSGASKALMGSFTGSGQPISQMREQRKASLGNAARVAGAAGKKNSAGELMEMLMMRR